MKNFIVTIARGFGSGGKRIGSQLGKELGINCYENRILTLASQYSGYDEHIFVENDERLRAPMIVNQLGKLSRTTKPKPVLSRFVSDPKLFKYQEEIIKQLAETESCIIIGKCADYVLRDYENVVSVYIEAPRAHCLKNIMQRMCITQEEANELITNTDRYRAEYYKFYTNGNYWTNPVNYDITLNSARVGDENCVRIIKDYLAMKNFI